MSDLFVDELGNFPTVCAQLPQWGREPSNPLDDIKAALEIMKRPAPSAFLNVQTVPAHLLPYTAPRLERERFSGGVNLSAQARNAALIAAAREAQELTYLVFGDTLFCSARGKEILQAKLRAAELPALDDAKAFRSGYFNFRGPSITDAELNEAKGIDLSLDWLRAEKTRIEHRIDFHVAHVIGLPFKPEPV